MIFKDDDAELTHLLKLWELQDALKRTLPQNLKYVDKRQLFASDAAKTLPRSSHVLWKALQPFLKVEELRLQEMQTEYEVHAAEVQARIDGSNKKLKEQRS